MKKLRETLESLELLCWNAVNGDKEEEQKVQEYLKAYPHLRTPALIDLLRQAIKFWKRIERLEIQLKEHYTPEIDALLDKKLRLYMTMIGNLGITLTRQQYKKKKTVVQPPIERLRMLNPKKESEENEE